MRSLQMIHRDIKPANLLLTTPHLASATVKIADFGFARCVRPQSLADTVCGTPLYMVSLLRMPARMFSFSSVESGAERE